MVKSSVVGLGKGNDKLARTLVAGKDADTCFAQAIRVHERDQLKEKIGLGFKEIWCFALDCVFEFLGIFAGDAVPGLGLAPVH